MMRPTVVIALYVSMLSLETSCGPEGPVDPGVFRVLEELAFYEKGALGYAIAQRELCVQEARTASDVATLHDTRYLTDNRLVATPLVRNRWIQCGRGEAYLEILERHVDSLCATLRLESIPTELRCEPRPHTLLTGPICTQDVADLEALLEVGPDESGKLDAAIDRRKVYLDGLISYARNVLGGFEPRY